MTRPYCHIKQLVITFLFVKLGGTASAQIINIDKTDTTAYQHHSVWNASFSVGLEVDKQKTTLLDATNYADLALQHAHELFIFSASNRITSNGDKSYLNTGYVHLRWRHDYKDQLHPESYLQYQWDENRGMVHRLVGGANLRYNFWHRRRWELTFATGLMYENERWDYAAVDSAKIPANPSDRTTSLLKSNNYLKWEGKLSATSDISLILYYQARFSAFFEPRVAGSFTYNVHISRHFSLGVKYNSLYDVRPVVPLPRFYYSLSTNLTYNL
ncbi:MAG TPA: DUF481 domain-containing protein [Chitinophagaceae bacterium]|nr:DUF481 domain-containing protein [Chitinophagaceae bacterium]